MSITRMRKRFSVTLKKVLWIIIVAFVFTIPATFAGLKGRGGLAGCTRPQGDSHQVVARINGEKMTRSMLTDAFMSQWSLLTYQQTPQRLPLQQITDVRLQGFDKAVDHMLLMQQVRGRKGIKPTQRDIAAKINERVDEIMGDIEVRSQRTGETIADIMRGMMAGDGKKVDRVTEAEFKRWLKEWLRDKERLAALKEELTLDKLKDSVVAGTDPTWKDVLASYDEIQFQEIQFRIKAEVEPADLRTYTKDNALKVAKEAAEQARNGADFTDLVMKYSSDRMATSGPGGEDSQPTKGIGPFLNIEDPRGVKMRYSRAVAKEARKYKKDQIVGPVWSKVLKSYYLLKVLDKRNRQPEGLDDAEKREQYLSWYRDRRRRDAFDDFKEEIREKAKLVINDPEIRAEQARRDGEFTKAAKLFDEALKYLIPWYQALPRDEPFPVEAVVPGAIYYTMGEMESLKQDWQKARDRYRTGLGFLSHDSLSLADMYHALAYNEWQWMTALEPGPERQEHKEKTQEWLKTMVNTEPESATVRENAIWLYEPLGMREVVAEHRTWLAEHYQQPGPDLNPGKALEHRKKLLEYYQELGDQEKADEQQKSIDEINKQLEEARSAQPGGPPAVPGGLTVTPVE